MNVWNAPAVMKENKARNPLCYAALLGAAACLCLLPLRAQAGSVPALMGVKEIIVKSARLSNEEASATCGISANSYTERLVNMLQQGSLPAFSTIKAPRHQEKVAQIDLLPEIVTLRQQGFDCLSWVSLSAQSRETLEIAPVKVPRNVLVTYWRGGLLISSNKTVHEAAIREGMEKLVAKFSRQYQIDQPPPLPDFD